MLCPFDVFRLHFCLLSSSSCFQGKIIVITGSAQGLGKAFARRLLSGGARVCISDIQDEVGLETCQELGMEFGKENLHFVRLGFTGYLQTISGCLLLTYLRFHLWRDR